LGSCLVQEDALHPEPWKGGILRPCRVCADILQDQTEVPLRPVGRDVSDCSNIGTCIESGDLSRVVCIWPSPDAWPTGRIYHDCEVEAWVAGDSVKELLARDHPRGVRVGGRRREQWIPSPRCRVDIEWYQDV
jgi:hypothetical protein